MYLLTRNVYEDYEGTRTSVIGVAETPEALRKHVATLGYTAWEGAVCIISVQDQNDNVFSF